MIRSVMQACLNRSLAKAKIAEPFLSPLLRLKTNMAGMFEERLVEEAQKYWHLYDASLWDYKDSQIAAS